MTPIPSPEPNYEAWLTKQQAALAIGVTTKTIEDLMKKQMVRFLPDYRRGEGGPRITVFHPDDVANYAAARKARVPPQRPIVVPSGAPVETAVLPSNGNGVRLTSRELFQQLDARIEALVKRAIPSQRASQTSQTSELLLLNKTYLTIPEAARLSGLSEANIRRRCQSGSLKAIKDGGWKIRRARLQKL